MERIAVAFLSAFLLTGCGDDDGSPTEGGNYTEFFDTCKTDSDCDDSIKKVCDTEPNRERCVECLEDSDCMGRCDAYENNSRVEALVKVECHLKRCTCPQADG